MTPTAELYKENCFVIGYDEEYIKDAFGQEPVMHENKELMEYLAAHIGSKEPSEKGFALDEPYATLYFTLSWLRKVREETDPVSQNPHWEISCDPVFHMEPGPPMIQVQMAAYQPVTEWLEELGARHVDLPLLYIYSREQEEEAKEDFFNHIGLENSNPILEQWNTLSAEEKALACYLQHHTDNHYRQSLCGAIMLLKGRISDAQFAQICCAASSISPHLGDVSEEMFKQIFRHFTDKAKEVQTVFKMLACDTVEK